MKKTITYFLFGAMLLCSHIANAQWVSLGTAGNLLKSGYNSFAIDASGNIYICFSEKTSGSYTQAYVRKFTGGTSWVDVGTSYFSAWSDYFEKLAIDGSGNLYVVASETQLDGTDYLKLYKFNGTTWVNKYGAQNGDYRDPCIATQGTNIYVGYADKGYGYQYSAAEEYNGSGWTSVGGAEGFAPASVDNPRIGVDKNGYVYYASSQYDSPYDILTEADSGSSWSDIGSPFGITGNEAITEIITTDNNGTPYLTYVQYGGQVVILKCVAGSWGSITSCGLSSIYGSGQEGNYGFAIDKTNNPCVVSIDSGGKLTMLRYNSGSWHAVGARNFSTPCGNIDGNGIYLAFDNNNIPYVAYNDTSGNVQVIKYNGLIGIDEVKNEALNIQLMPNPASKNIRIEMPQTINEKSQIQIYDALGRAISEAVQVVAGIKQMDISYLQPGIYFVQLKSGSEMVTKRFVKE